MKNLKKSISLMLATLTMLSLAACGGGGGGIPGLDDSSDGTPTEGKRALYVGVYDGGLSYSWAQRLEKKFEAIHTDVDVVIRHKKNDYDDSMLLTQIANNDEDIYYGNSNVLSSLVANNLLEDLTDVVTEKIFNDDVEPVETGATKSIEDTIWEDWKQFVKINDSYYAIPNFTSVAGIAYDADLFEEKGYDVPETYDELSALMDQMANQDNITPFAFSSMAYIVDTAFREFHANYEGRNNFYLNSTFSGTDSVLGEITPENAYLLQKQNGKKAAFQFAYDLANNANYTTALTRTGGDYLQSQKEFVNSVGASGNTRRVAMFLENSWWEREVKSTIESMGEINPEWGWGQRNFKYMVAPVNDKLTDRDTISCSYTASMVFISKNSKRKDLAKEWLKFCQSREALSIYAAETCCLRPYDFTMTEELYEECTPYMKSIIDLTLRDDVDFVPFGAANSVANRITDFSYDWCDKSSVKGQTPSAPYSFFMAYPSVTVDQYFEGCYTYFSGKWSSYIL